MSLRKDVARVVRLKEFHSRVEKLLTPEDRDYFFYALKEYNAYKSVAKLMLALNSCLDTPEKLDLLPSIRELIPRHDRKKFDNLAPYNRMAHPPLAPVPAAPPQPPVPNGGDMGAAGTGGEELKPDGPPGFTLGAVKTVYLQRSKGESLGFSIRGGHEHDIGIFISHIDPFSLAENSGLVAGDKIVSVNGFNFDSITHQSAVLILRSHDRLQISVISVGHVPGHGPRERKSLIWVDTSGKPVDEKTEELTTSLEEDRGAGDRLLASPDKHKIVLKVERNQALGFSVRGGKEFSLGIFISQVDGGSPAEQFGLKRGDQIVGVNGHSFLSILHHEAVSILKSYTTLVMTVRSLGRLPLLVSEDEEDIDGPTNSSPSTFPLSPPSHQQPVHSSKEQDHAHNTNGHTHSNAIHQKRRSDWRKSVSRRSQSLRDFLRPRSLYSPHTHHPHHPHHNPRSHSYRHQHHSRHRNQDLSPHSRLRTGSDGALTHHSRPRGSTHSPSSPLTAPPQKASSPKTLTLSGTSPTPHDVPQKDQTNPLPLTVDTREQVGEEKKEMFFRYGVGTQLMLATASSSAKALLEDSARRCLEAEEMNALTERLREYESNGGVEGFAEFLVSLLDTPTKMQLLSDVRSLLNPTDLVTFDGIVSPHEISALQKRTSSLRGQEMVVTTTAAVTATTPNKLGRTAGETDSPQLLRGVSLSTRSSSKSREGGGERQPTSHRRVIFDEEAGGSAEEEDDDCEAATSPSGRGGQREKVSSVVDDGREMGRGVAVTESPVGGGGSSLVSQRTSPLSEEDTLLRDEEREREGGEREEVREEGEREEDEGVVEEEEEEEEEGEYNENGGDEELVQEQEEGKREGDEEEERKEEGGKELKSSQNYNLVLYEIENHRGQGSLRRAVVREGGMGSPHIGAFGADPANNLLSRASNEETSTLGMQTRESFLEWNDDYTTDSRERNRDHAPSRNPVIIEIVKSAPQLGLTITGGVDTSSPGVIITDVKEGGAAGIDGFLQPGFEIVEVDGVRIRGLTHDSAARELATAFRSERPTIELIVIPN